MTVNVKDCKVRVLMSKLLS